MFTGIIEEVGRVAALDRAGARARLAIACSTVLDGTGTGDSIAVDGCCLTASTIDADGFSADLMATTLEATALGDLDVGAAVNLERPLAADGRFGGHLVQGHVDGVGEVTAIDDQPGTRTVSIASPAPVARYLVPKGSITVQGVSLTVVDVDVDDAGAAGGDGATFTLGLIPHTLEVTTLGSLTVGDRTNLEADVIAKYVERFLGRGEQGV